MAEDCTELELRELARNLRWRGPNPNDARFLSVFMDQNNKCNLRCLMCGFSDARVAALAKYDMSRWLFDRIAAELFPRANYVCLSLLTEPFMPRDFPDRLASVRQYGVPFSEVITNATLLTATSCAKLVDAQLSRVIISIDGGTKATFEAISVGARFETVIANFRLLRYMRHELPLLRGVAHERGSHPGEHEPGLLGQGAGGARMARSSRRSVRSSRTRGRASIV